MSSNQADLAARILTAHPQYGEGRYQPQSETLDDLEGVEIIPSTVYSYPQVERSGRRGRDRDVRLTVYAGLGDLGIRLWEQELRVLRRIGALNHPALPRLIGGAIVPADVTYEGAVTTSAVGYIRTFSGDADLSIRDGGRGLATSLHDDPAAALQKFWLLADGLSLLHDSRISHRNLWPETLEIYTNPDGGLGIRLSRFEMSTMISNLLRQRSSTVARQATQSVYAGQDRKHLLYCPPERLSLALGGENDDADAGLMSGDVFSLGMIAIEWFLGPEVFAAADLTDQAGIRAAQTAARKMVAQSLLPPELRVALTEMTVMDRPRDRWEAFRVVQHINSNFETIRARLLDIDDAPPYVVAYFPGYSDATLYRGFRLLTNSSETDEGRDELEDFVVEDMRDAQVAYSPTGAHGFVRATATGGDDDLKSATTVVFGRQIIWFCATYFKQTPIGKRDFPDVRAIKYVVRASDAERWPRLHELRTVGLQRRLTSIAPIDAFDTPTRTIEKLTVRCGNWADLVRTETRVGALSDKAESYLGVLQWLIDFQNVQLDAATYAYRLDPATAHSRTQLLRWNDDLEARRRHTGTSLAQKYLASERLRKDMADHFEDAANEDPAAAKIDVLDDSNGRPGAFVANCHFDQVRGTGIAVHSPQPLPPQGWIRLADDRANRSNISRQVTAVAELRNNRLLVEHLVDPPRSSPATDRWSHAGGKLRGEGRKAVRQLLAHDTMFALQGPPGTGKTEVTSQAVSDHLLANRGDRLLISAQSHSAVDGLGERILAKLGLVDSRGRPKSDEWVALRVTTEKRVQAVDSEVMRQFFPKEVTDRIVRNAKRAVTEWLTVRRPDNPALVATLREWLERLDDSTVDLRPRVQNGANLVFSTTGAATQQRLVDQYGAVEPFDWVLIEEAAKAWPTELALPLVRGQRWSLIGDHAQIGAFNRNQVEQFLHSCNDDPTPEIADWYARKDEFIRAFDTFGTFFEVDPVNKPTMQLSEQRRMNDDISAVVSAGFYAHRSAGGLITRRAETPHGLVKPHWLQDQTLVWIDTGDVRDAESTGSWRNEYEAKIVSALARAMSPQPGRSQDGTTLAILTPYLKQKEVLTQRLAEIREMVHTIDGFQGRESDIVIASLVRDHPPAPGRQHAAVGHIGEPARANVLLSRARNLLVVVGRFDVYANTGVDEWDRVIATFLERGLVVPATENFGDL